MEGLHAVCTDEDEALSGGILQETCGTIHLLGLEHVQDSIERKLTELSFPVRQRKLIQADIFGGPAMGVDGCLYDCESEEEFNQNRKRLKPSGKILKDLPRRIIHPSFARISSGIRKSKSERK